MSLEIQKIQPLDLPTIEEIGKICLPLYYSAVDLVSMIVDVNHYCLKVVAKDSKEIMGFVIAEFYDNNQKTESKTGSRIHIKSLGVLPKYRRNGAARLLINYLKFQKTKKVYDVLLLYGTILCCKIFIIK